MKPILLGFSRITFLLVLAYLMNSCGYIPMKMAINNTTVERHAIPPDFGKEETTLLVLIGPKRSDWGKYTKKHVTAEYHGAYEFAPKDEWEGEKYEDIEKYRYVLITGKKRYTYSSYDSSNAGNWTTSTMSTNRIQMLDRKTGRTYRCPITSSFFSKLIKGYMRALEIHRVAQ